MQALKVINLKKEYPSFTLNNLSFSVGEGRVVGFIGRNGAGKSTTIKGILGLISISGEVRIFDVDAVTHQSECKELIGYVGGGFRFYPEKTLKAIKQAYAPFYKNWDDKRYFSYLNLFNIDENKKVKELSEGMKVKFSLALSLSHDARLLIMDEPTSGLDPLSRDEFCSIILSLVKNEGVTVLFSTHIITDLESIADDVIYISDGEILLDCTLNELGDKYRIIKFKEPNDVCGLSAIGIKPLKEGYEALIETPFSEVDGVSVEDASIEKVMVHLEIERSAR